MPTSLAMQMNDMPRERLASSHATASAKWLHQSMKVLQSKSSSFTDNCIKHHSRASSNACHDLLCMKKRYMSCKYRGLVHIVSKLLRYAPSHTHAHFKQQASSMSPNVNHHNSEWLVSLAAQRTAEHLYPTNWRSTKSLLHNNYPHIALAQYSRCSILPFILKQDFVPKRPCIKHCNLYMHELHLA